MALERYTRGFEDEVEVLAQMSIGRMWDRMLGEFLDRWSQLQRLGLDADEMERELRAHLDGLSPKFEQDVARQSSGVAYNQGRSAQILTEQAEGRVQVVVRSEVLDENTCAPCASLDGAITEVGTPDYHALMPPSQCQGGDRCRGFYVPIRGGGDA